MGFTPIVLILLTWSVTVLSWEGKLKNLRNFAHVLGKRTSVDLYDETPYDETIEKFPGYRFDYTVPDDSYHLRRGEPSTKNKANVAHMFGRELYDTYPDYGDTEIYKEPKLESEEDMIEVPTDREDILMRLPEIKARMRQISQQQRFTLSDLLSASRAKRRNALAYLNHIINSEQGKV